MQHLQHFFLLCNNKTAYAKLLGQGWDVGVVKITRGGLGLDNIFVDFCQIHVKKLDKMGEILDSATT